LTARKTGRRGQRSQGRTTDQSIEPRCGGFLFALPANDIALGGSRFDLGPDDVLLIDRRCAIP